MKLEKRKVNELTRQLENFKKGKLSEDLELDDKVIIEVPIVMGSQLKDIQKNKEIASKVEAETQKAVDEFKKDEQKNIDEAKKQIKSFLGTLDEHYKDLYLKEGNDYTVHCKGRKELRQLIEQCKLNNIRYKWEKLVEGDYRYDVKFSLQEAFGEEEIISNDVEEIPTQEIPAPQPEPVQPQAVDLNNLKLGDAIVVTQNLLDALMQTKQSVEAMQDTLNSTPIQEPIQEPVEVEQDTEIEVNEGLKLNEKLDLEALKKLLQDFKDGKFELDTLTIDKDGWVATSESSYAVEENLQPKDLGQTQINEGLEVVGSLDDYAPSDKAKPLYDEIVAEGMLDDLDKLLGEIYQDGASINELNNLLANEKDFVRSMLGLGEPSLQDEEDKEFEQSITQEIEDDDVKPASEKEPLPQSKGSVNDYFSSETGYGDDDDEDEDLSSLEAIIDSKEAEEM